MRLHIIVLALCAGAPLARANLGETLAQITARYGTGTKVQDTKLGGKTDSLYRYSLNGRNLYVDFVDGKSCQESIQAAKGDSLFTEDYCVRMMTTIAGRTNWVELRALDGVIWVSGEYTAILSRDARAKHDNLYISTTEYFHETTDPAATAHPPEPGARKAESKSEVDARVLKWQQYLADKGDAYGEYHMDLRYRDGDGVPQDVEMARRMFESAAGQGNADAAAALAKLPPKPPAGSTAGFTDPAHPRFIIHSAEFSAGDKRVVKLLRDNANGFVVNVQNLGVDPDPANDDKMLTIHYDFRDDAYTATVKRTKRLNYQLLTKGANK